MNVYLGFADYYTDLFWSASSLAIRFSECKKRGAIWNQTRCAAYSSSLVYRYLMELSLGLLVVYNAHVHLDVKSLFWLSTKGTR